MVLLDCIDAREACQSVESSGEPGRAGRRAPVCYNATGRRSLTPRLQHIRAPLEAVKGSLDGAALYALCALRRRARTQSLRVYLVGGPVRDVLLGTPIKDLDFVVEGDAPEVARQLAEELDARVVVHSRFGTATVVLGAGGIDLVTARREDYPRPAALPVVSPGSIYDDLARRDFSINALALPLAEVRPKVLDPHGGLDDLRRGVLRVLHSKSFADDPTRILRAVRYEGRFGFHLEDGTLSLLESAVAQGNLGLLTGDRLRHELARILQEDRPEPVLQRAWGLGVLASIHPLLGDEGAPARLAALAGSEVNAGGVPPLPAPGGIDPLAYLGSLVYPLSGGDGEALINRLNLPATWAEVVRDTIRLRELEPELAVPDMERSRLFHLVEGFSQTAALAVSRVTASAPVAKRLSEYWNELSFVTPALNGGDLLAMGVPEGPLVGQMLRELQDARLDRRVVTADEERRLVRQSLARLGGRPDDG